MCNILAFVFMYHQTEISHRSACMHFYFMIRFVIGAGAAGKMLHCMYPFRHALTRASFLTTSFLFDENVPRQLFIFLNNEGAAAGAAAGGAGAAAGVVGVAAVGAVSAGAYYSPAMQARRAGNTTGAVETADGDVTPEGLVTLQPSSRASNQIGSPSPSNVLTSFPDIPPSIFQEQVPVFTPTYWFMKDGEDFGDGSGSSSPIPTTTAVSPVPTIAGGGSDGAEGNGAGQGGNDGSTGALSPSPTSKDHNGSTLSPAGTGEYSQIPTASDGSGGGGGDEVTKIPTLAPQDEAGSSLGTTSSPSPGNVPPIGIGDETTSAPVNAPTTEQIFEETGLSDGIAPSALPSIEVLPLESGHPSEEPHSSLLPTLASDNLGSSSLPSVAPADQPGDATDSFPSSLPNSSPIEPGMTNGPSSFAPSIASSNSPSFFPTDNRPSSSPTAGPLTLPAVKMSESPTDNPTEGPSKKPTEEPTQQPSPRPTKVRMICLYYDSFCSIVQRYLLCGEPFLTDYIFSSIYRL